MHLIISQLLNIHSIIYKLNTIHICLYTNIGLGVTLVGSIPKAGIRFGGNAYCKQLLSDGKGGKLNMGQQFLAGNYATFYAT